VGQGYLDPRGSFIRYGLAPRDCSLKKRRGKKKSWLYGGGLLQKMNNFPPERLKRDNLLWAPIFREILPKGFPRGEKNLLPVKGGGPT